MYAAGAEHPLKRPCIAILEAIAHDELAAVTNVEVVQEILYRYSALGQRKKAVEVSELFLKVVPVVLPIVREDIVLALDLHLQYQQLQARDSIHLAVMRNHDLDHLISADQHFDGVSDVIRIDPLNWYTERLGVQDG